MYDKDELNKIASGRMKDLYELMTGKELHRHSNQWEGECLVCGHTMWVSDRTPDHFYCRTCGRSYYASHLVSCYYGLTEPSQFQEALQKLADFLGVTENNIQEYKSNQPKVIAPVLYETKPETPSDLWQTTVKPIVKDAYNYLGRKDYNNPEAAYLLNRGFTKDTLRKYCIGYNREKQDLNITEDGKQVVAPKGYFIPTFIRIQDGEHSSVLTRVKVRQPDTTYKYLYELWQSGKIDHKPDKYISVTGSKGVTLFCNQYTRPSEGNNFPNVIYVEGEFDAMTINQTAGDICKAVTFGSHSNIGKAETWVRWYTIPENTVICFDNEVEPEKQKKVREHEQDLQSEIIRAQSIIPCDVRPATPVIRHLDEQYHDWNDILQQPGGVQTIRNTLMDFFVRR